MTFVDHFLLHLHCPVTACNVISVFHVSAVILWDLLHAINQVYLLQDATYKSWNATAVILWDLLHAISQVVLLQDAVYFKS